MRLSSFIHSIAICLLYSACTKTADQTASTHDTIPVEDSSFSSPAPIISQKGIRIAVDFNEDKEIEKILRSIFAYDSVFQSTELADADVQITGWEWVYEGSLFTPREECKNFRILHINRTEASSGNTFTEWYVVTGEEATFTTPLSVDITPSQGEQEVNFFIDQELGGNCPVAAVEESYEGGDIDFGKSNYLTFYSVDETGFSEIISINLEDQVISDYYGEDSQPQVQTNLRKDYTILSTISHGLHDLQIITSNLNEEGETMDSDGEICQWNGVRYDCSPMIVD
jgi:hypothetical protein